MKLLIGVRGGVGVGVGVSVSFGSSGSSEGLS